MERDFEVTVKSDDEKIVFEGKKCITKKTLRNRLGMTKKVTETLECKNFKIKKK